MIRAKSAKIILVNLPPLFLHLSRFFHVPYKQVHQQQERKDYCQQQISQFRIIAGKLRVFEQQDEHNTGEPDVLGIVFF